MRVLLTALLLLGLCGPVAAAELTLKRVMLSSGGVGYFEYGADVDDDNNILGLDVPLGQVDDILKSLVVFDPSGGVAGIELPGRDDTVQAFADAPFGPEALDSPTAYLNALRGTDVTVQGPHPMTGRIIRAETVTESVDTISMQRTRVTLLGADGLRQFLLEEADGVQVTDPTLRARIERALETLRRDANATTRHLTIRLTGKGERTIAIGYVAGAPLWKATYRLMLPAGSTPAARLQGWATLENQSGADWKGVLLTLQYGNPVTFRQALYRSYFVQRPEVPVEILGHVLPDVDVRAKTTEAASMPMMPPPPPAPAPAGIAMHRAMRPVMAAQAEAASTEETGEETSFTLAEPVDLAAGHTANVPILDRAVPATRIGLVPFQQTHPLAAIRVRNDGALALPAGVLTLYDADESASFAGDARLGGLPAGETRLLSFARDLRTDVDTKLSPLPNIITAFSVADGVLTYTSRIRQAIRIEVTAPAKESRDLLLEIPRSSDEQALTFEDGKTRVAEQTAGAFRVALTLAAGESRTISAWLDQPARQTVALVDGDDAILQVIVGTEKLSASGRGALRHVLDLRQDLTQKQAEVARQQKLLQDVEADEDRLRKNLVASDALRTRLTKSLDADETKIEQLRKTIDDVQTEVDKAHRALTDAVATLKI